MVFALCPVFRAGVRYAVALRAAVPVEAQGCGVVGEFAAEGVKDCVCEVLDGLAWMQVPAGQHQRGDVEALGTAFEHPVGQEEQAVAGLQGQLLLAPTRALHRAERLLRGELDLLGLPWRRRNGGGCPALRTRAVCATRSTRTS